MPPLRTVHDCNAEAPASNRIARRKGCSLAFGVWFMVFTRSFLAFGMGSGRRPGPRSPVQVRARAERVHDSDAFDGAACERRYDSKPDTLVQHQRPSASRTGELLTRESRDNCGPVIKLTRESRGNCGQ